MPATQGVHPILLFPAVPFKHVHLCNDVQKVSAQMVDAGHVIQVEIDVAPTVEEYVFPVQVVHHVLLVADFHEPA